MADPPIVKTWRAFYLQMSRHIDLAPILGDAASPDSTANRPVCFAYVKYQVGLCHDCLLYTSDAADDSVLV